MSSRTHKILDLAQGAYNTQVSGSDVAECSTGWDSNIFNLHEVINN